MSRTRPQERGEGENATRSHGESSGNNRTVRASAGLWVSMGLVVLVLCAAALHFSRANTPSSLPDAIVLNAAPDQIELFAAQELQKYLHSLFGRRPPIISETTNMDLTGDHFVILGQPAKSEMLRKLSQAVDWSDSEQTYALVPTHWHGKKVIALAGASAAAVLWAAYELIETWGVRFDLDGDLFPERPPIAQWLRNTVVRRPAIPMRVLTGHNLHVEGPASWGIDDYRKFLDQAAKLRYNGYMFMLRDMGPWFDLEFKGVRKRKADIYGGGWQIPYRITSDLIGYEHLKHEEPVFYNPWFHALKTDSERLEAGPRLVRAIFDHARRRGMKTGVYFELTNLPPEMKEGFAQLTGSSKNYEGIPKEDWYLKSKEDVTNPLLWDLIETKLRAIQGTYPDLDFYEFGQMEHTSATAKYLPLWQKLDRKYGVGRSLDLEEVLAHADRYPVRNNYEENVAGEIEFLWLVDQIFVERQALGRIFPPTGQLLVGNGVTTLEFFPILPLIWPPQIRLAAWLEYGYHRAADKLGVLDGLAKHKTRAWMNNCLDEDNNLWLAQNTVEAIHATLKKVVSANIEGMEVGHWRVRDVAPAARFMSEACWNPRLGPEEFYLEYLQDRVGTGAAGSMEQGFRKLEQADRYTSLQLLGIAFCYPGRFEPYLHAPDKQNEEKLRESLRLYTESWKSFESSLRQVSALGRPFAQAWTNRADFSRRYLEMLLLARRLGMALKLDQPESEFRKKAPQLAKELVDHVRKMLVLIASDVQDRSDQGTLVSLNYLLYKPALEIQKKVLEDLGP